MKYNWQQKDWPNFIYDLSGIENELFSFAGQQGHINGILKALPEDAQMEVIIETMVSEAIKTSEIEGEHFSRKDVRSSIRNNLGLNKKNEHLINPKAGNISELMIDVRNTYKEKLTKEKLFSWHSLLMNGNTEILVGDWRTHKEPMQVISGALGKQKIHYEAPRSERVPAEMEQFITWFNETGPGGNKEIRKPPVRSAIAHIYFETIHPFEDGNGRIGRAIAEKALSQGIGRPMLLSLSRAIETNKKAYYDALERAQQSCEITGWIAYFVKTILDAQSQSEEQVNFTLKKTKLFDRFKDDINNRQLIVITRMLEEGPKDFRGGMNARKYISLTRTSKATATRDMQDLVNKGVFALIGEAGGRSTSYRIIL